MAPHSSIRRPRPTKQERRVRTIEAEIRTGLTVVQYGQTAFSAGDLPSARDFHDAAQLLCTSILRLISRSAEEEAVAIETPFTEFEDKLLDLAVSTGRLTHRRLRLLKLSSCGRSDLSK